jgi:DNA invertase Pin-like site-specific DNA recombinase
MNKQPDTMTALYYRVANKQQHLHLDNQMHQLHSFAAESKIDAYTVYADVGFSGLNFDRPAFQQMRAAIAAGQVKQVVTLDMSRISRNLLDAMEFTEWTEQQGVSFITLNGDHRQFELNRHFLSELTAQIGGEQQ